MYKTQCYNNGDVEGDVLDRCLDYKIRYQNYLLKQLIIANSHYACQSHMQQIPNANPWLQHIFKTLNFRYCCDSSKMHRPLSVSEFNDRFAKLFPTGGLVVPKVPMSNPVSYTFFFFFFFIYLYNQEDLILHFSLLYIFSLFSFSFYYYFWFLLVLPKGRRLVPD